MSDNSARTWGELGLPPPQPTAEIPMPEATGAGWNDLDATIDARMIELGMAEPGQVFPGSGYYYGDILPPEHYEDNAVPDLGLMPDGSFRAPAVGRAAAALDEAVFELMAARDNRDYYDDRSLPTLNAVCYANVAVHRAEQALAAAEQREAAGELNDGGDARRQLVDDEQILHHSLVLRERAEREAEDERGHEPEH